MATNLPTPEELTAAAQRKLRTELDPEGTGKVKLATGSRLDTAISVNVALAKRTNAAIADRATAASMYSATGDDLLLKAKEFYGAELKEASAARTTIYLTRTNSPAAQQTVIPAGQRFGVKQTAQQPGIFFAADQDVPVAVGVLKVAVPVTCTQTGQVGNVDRAIIDQIVDPLPETSPASAPWSIYQPVFGDPVLGGGDVDQVAGGDEAEDPEELRQRCLAGSFDATRTRGVKDAITSAVLAVPGISSVVVVEPLDGTILVYCGDSNYLLSDALKSLVQTTLQGYRCLGVPAIVRRFTVVTVVVNVTLYMSRALTEYDIQALKKQAVDGIKAYFKNRPRPDEYFKERIAAAAGSASAETQNVTVTSPAADQQRPADEDYAALTTINRYVVDESSITVSIAEPQTT